MNPIGLIITLVASLVLGSLYFAISTSNSYSLIPSISAIAEPPLLTQQPWNWTTTQPLLIGLLLGCSLAALLYNILRFIYTRYTCNIFFAIALGFFLLFFTAGLLSTQASFLPQLNSDFIYIAAVLGLLFLHALCMSYVPKATRFKKLPKQLTKHMAVLCVGGISLLILAPPYAYILSFYLLLSSSVMLLGTALQLWRNHYPPARTLFIGLSTLCVPQLLAWPAFSNNAFFSADTAALISLISIAVSAFIISIGLSKSHREQVAKNTSVSQRHVAQEAENRAKTEFLAKISHEIRTPLSGVLGMTTLLLDTPLSSKQRDYAQTIQESGNELLSLINEILDITRLESNAVALSHTQFNLAALLQECSQIFSNKAHEQHTELTIFLQPQVPEILLGDPVRLRQVLLSILKNCFQRTFDGEVILSAALELHNTQTQLVFSVQDTGTPLSAEECNILNTAQLHSKDLLSASFIGGNLGVIIARQLVQLMAGQFKTQRSAQGTLFTFSIAFNPQHSQSAHTEAEAVLHQQHILIIDSNMLSQKVLAQQCSELGLLVSTCSSPTDAVALLRNKALQGQHFAAILISETTHKPSAIAFAVRIKEDPILTTDATLIMLTSSSQTDLIAARNAGISQVLIKPVSGSTLKATLINAIQQATMHNRTTPNVSTKHVLVAEDDAISVKVISGLLHKLGATLDIAANGKIALEMLQKNTYDLVLMDCEMPVMDGFTAAQKRRSYEAEHGLTAVPIIALSAHVLEEHRVRAKQAGMDGHLAKPIELAKLQALLSNNAAAPRAKPS